MREIILGCPGAGKTATLLQIVEGELASGTLPERIAYVTFTRRAAEEAITRACSQFNLKEDRLPLFRTLHSLAFRELGLSADEVFQGARVREFAEWAGVEISPRAWSGRAEQEGLPTWHRPGDRAMHLANLARVRCVPLAQLYNEDDDDLVWDEVDYMARAAEAFKRRYGLVDFTDMISNFAQEKKMPTIDVLVVDECFPGDTPVLVGLDGSWLNIKTIVDTRYTGPIISWNEKIGTITSRVVGHKKVLRNKTMKQIKFFVKNPPRDYSPGASIVVCTEDHRVKTSIGWLEAGQLTPGQTVFVETAQVRVKSYQHKHKITPVGKQTLSAALKNNKRGLGNNMGEGHRELFLSRKGGNGRGLSVSEQLFLDKIQSVGTEVTPHAIITTGFGRSGTYPPHYKVDFLINNQMLVVEIDGQSHHDSLRKKLDVKKTKLLNSLGYDVVRFTNKEVATLTPKQLDSRLKNNCLVEAEILSVVEYETMETYVYDIEVENTHCYFAHGLLVHNCQDLSRLQWQMVNSLASGARRVVVAGDDDQAIYRWAGADVEHLVAMPGRVRVLEQSYRVPAVVQQLADAVIGPVVARRPKRWRPRPEPGEVAYGSLEQEEAWAGEWSEGVQPVLCLARNTYVLEERVAPVLRRLGVLYEWAAQPPVAPAALAAVHAWEQLRGGAALAADVVRGVYRALGAGCLARGHRELPGVPDEQPLTIAELEVHHGLRTRAPWYETMARRLGEDAVTYLRAARARGERLNQRPRVRLSTIHGAKGGEARRVVLCTEMAARTWREMEENEDDERRVWYVAATRAREQLVIVPSERTEACPWL